jgi:secondary thiamine-phosphate synthase enzyme
MDKIKVRSQKSRQVIDITQSIEEFLQSTGLENGLLHIFILHTTAAVGIADLDPGTDLDMLDAFEAIMPKLKYRHPHDPEHVIEHILSTMIGVSVTVPVHSKKLVLGTWQRVVLLEFSGPRERTLIVTPMNTKF